MYRIPPFSLRLNEVWHDLVLMSMSIYVMFIQGSCGQAFATQLSVAKFALDH